MSSIIPPQGLQPFKGLDTPSILMRVQVENAKSFFRQFAILKHVVRPEASLRFVRNLLNKNIADILELGVHGRIAADDGYDAGITVETAKGETEVVWGHVPKTALVLKQSRAIRACQVAFVRDVDIDNAHLIRTAHLS